MEAVPPPLAPAHVPALVSALAPALAPRLHSLWLQLSHRHAGDADSILIVTHREGMYDLCGGRGVCPRIGYCGMSLLQVHAREDHHEVRVVVPPSSPSVLDPSAAVPGSRRPGGHLGATV